MKLHILKALLFKNGMHISQCPIQESLLPTEFCFVDSAVLATQPFLCLYLERNKKKMLSWRYSSLFVFFF